jgi:phage shock protein PspC (stress-responsive transcriptional regulator)
VTGLLSLAALIALRFVTVVLTALTLGVVNYSVANLMVNSKKPHTNRKVNQAIHIGCRQ